MSASVVRASETVCGAGAARCDWLEEIEGAKERDWGIKVEEVGQRSVVMAEVCLLLPQHSQV